MSSASILDSWKEKKFKPLYWLQGTEEFFIDEIVDFAEHNILSEEEASFNLTIFYGRDANWGEVLNACRRYPVFSDRQVVLLKEAQHMRDIEKLEPYIEKPNAQTIFIASYKGKTVDGRTRFALSLKKHGEIFTSKKIYDNQLPSWTNGYIQSKGLQITPKGLSLLVDHVGNDLSRITNEINKLSINLQGKNMISEDDIEQYIGISKDYNIFELQEALSFKNHSKALSIIQYMEGNPNAIPAQLVMATLYGYFSKLMTVSQMKERSDRTLFNMFYNNPSTVKQASAALVKYSFSDLERVILLLHHYNLKSIGIGSQNTPPGSLMKELMFKIME